MSWALGHYMLFKGLWSIQVYAPTHRHTLYSYVSTYVHMYFHMLYAYCHHNIDTTQEQDSRSGVLCPLNDNRIYGGHGCWPQRLRLK